MRCGQWGCECTTCLECNQYRESCKCTAIAKEKELRERFDKWQIAGEDEQAVGMLQDAMAILKELA
jgi:hypothetical protein